MNLKRKRIEIDPTFCAVCGRQFDTGIVDPFHPYHQEKNKCEGCMTEEDWKRVNAWPKPPKPEGESE